MTDNTAPQAPAQIPAISGNPVNLEDISLGKIQPTVFSTQALTTAPKFKNNVLRAIAEQFRISKLSERAIVEYLLALDEGYIDEDFLNKLKNDPNFINSFLTGK